MASSSSKFLVKHGRESEQERPYQEAIDQAELALATRFKGVTAAVLRNSSRLGVQHLQRSQQSGQVTFSSANMPKAFETLNKGAPKFLPANSIKLNTSYYLN